MIKLNNEELDYFNSIRDLLNIKISLEIPKFGSEIALQYTILGGKNLPTYIKFTPPQCDEAEIWFPSADVDESVSGAEMEIMPRAGTPELEMFQFSTNPVIASAQYECFEHRKSHYN